MSVRQQSAETLTFLAEPGRADDRELSTEIQQALADPCVQVALDAAQGYLLVLNRQRQILAGNRAFLEAVGEGIRSAW